MLSNCGSDQNRYVLPVKIFFLPHKEVPTATAAREMCKFGSVHVHACDFSKFRSWRPQASKQLLPVNPVQFDSVQVHSQPWADYCNGYREICQVSFLTSSKTAGRLVNNSCPLCRRRIGLPLKNLEFPDCSCGPVTFGLGLPPKISSCQTAAIALSPSHWACHQKISSSQMQPQPRHRQRRPATQKVRWSSSEI